MPLPFPSRSHGPIAFGFFNIASDMLLLQELFFFADRFCAAVAELALERHSAPLPCWRLARSAVGDLHGAIAGVDLSGFIGATYRLFPFPARRELFKQGPEGQETQPQIAELADRHGAADEIALRWDEQAGLVSVDSYCFTEAAFRELVAYVDRGGYPRWRDEQRPDYVREVVSRLRGTVFDPVDGR